MSFLSNMRIGLRLAISFLVLLLLLVGISIVALTRMKEQALASEVIINQDVTRVMYTNAIKAQAQKAALTLLQILPTPERDDRIKLYKAMDKENLMLDQTLAKVAKSYGETKPEQLTNIIKLRETYSANFLETVEYVEVDAEYAIEHYNDSTRRSLEALLDEITAFQQFEQQRMLNEQTATEAANQSAQQFVIVLALLALILGLFLATTVSRSIIHPIKDAVDFARDIAKGNLRPHKSTPRNDEIGELNTALNDMRDGLFSLISSIRESSENIQSSATDLSNPVNLVNSGSLQQVDAVDEISSVIVEFSRQSNQSTTTAQEAKNQSTNARDLASTGQEMIENATGEFAKISETISGSAQAVEVLYDRAKAVRELVTIVSQIADQTNLLALNAAIEAARAGESGRGFSVVADEVRALASRTASATVEINTVIDAIEKETENVVSKISVGKTEMEQGVSLLQQMVEPLINLRIGAQSSLESLQLLETSVASQAHESQQIGINIEHISNKAGENQSAIEAVTNTTQNLTLMADGLSNQVKKFQLN